MMFKEIYALSFLFDLLYENFLNNSLKFTEFISLVQLKLNKVDFSSVSFHSWRNSKTF
jgi:hypothetical protein